MRSLFYILVLVAYMLSGISAEACTTFIVSGKRTADGRPLLFKHRDTDVLDNALVYFSDGKYDYIGLVTSDKSWSSMVWGGYNSAGFAIINSAAYNNNSGDTTRLADREGVLMKLALQYCANLADFERLLDTLPKPLGVDANFGVIDAAGGAAYYETGNFRYVKYDVNDPAVAPDGYLVRTNHSMSGDPLKGLGHNRYNTASAAMAEASATGNFEPQYLFTHISRNLRHALTGANLDSNIPADSTPDFRFFMDYIPRYSSAADIMIVGAKDVSQASGVMMWTILGFSLTSVAVPVWISGGSHLPAAVGMKPDLHAPLCDAALAMKEKCFPSILDGGKNYINLSAVINSQNSGYMQMLHPVEEAVFAKAGEISPEGGNGIPDAKAVQSFYCWLDSYLADSYKRLTGINLF